MTHLLVNKTRAFNRTQERCSGITSHTCRPLKLGGGCHGTSRSALRASENKGATATAQDKQPVNMISSDLPPSFAKIPQESVRKPPTFMEAAICRLYYFSKEELHVIEELVASMANCRAGLTALAIANILLSLVQASGYMHSEHATSSAVISDSGLTIGDVAYWADSLMVAALISYAVGPFDKVLKSRSNQMAYTFQGVNRLALIFQQLSIGSVAVSTVTGLEAAAKYPPLVVGTSAVFFAVAAVRSAAMWWTLTQHTANNEEVRSTLTALRDPQSSAYAQQMSTLDRWAVFLAFGYLLQYEDKAMTVAVQPSASAETSPAVSMSTVASSLSTANATIITTADQPHTSVTTNTVIADGCGPVDADGTDYEFSLAEERVLRGLTEAANTAGLALGLQAFVTLMLTVADYGVGDLPDVISNGINFTNKAIMAALLFSACSSYDRALHTAGCGDVEHLIDGLGHKGLTGLFESLAVLSWAITIATMAGLALPFIEENVLARFVGDVAGHRGAEAVIEAIEYMIRILRSL